MPYTPKNPDWEHQAELKSLMRGVSHYALFMEMGTGKTKPMIDVMCELYVGTIIDAVLVFAPKGVHSNWVDIEIPEHMPDDIRAAAAIHAWAGGGSKRERDVLVQFFDGPRKFRILTVNIEALAASTKIEAVLKQFISMFKGRFLCIVDESTVIKNPSAVRTKKAIAVGRHANRRWIATGSPVTKNPLDLYSQFEFMAPSLLGHRSFYSYRSEYCIMRAIEVGGRQVQVPVSYINLDKLEGIVKQHSYRKLKKDCLDLPPKIYMPPRPVDMTDEQRRVYAAMRDDATAAINSAVIGEDGAITHASATVVLAQLSKLHQICTGFVVDEDGVEHDLPSNRPRVLLEDIEETGVKPTIIWCAYRRNVTAVVEALTKAHGADSIVQYHGGVKDAERTEAKRLFQAGEKPFMVATKAMARGHTLNRAEYTKFFSTTNSLDDRQQEEDRAHRGIMDHSVVYSDYHCPGTVEMKIIKNLRRGIDIASTILGDGYREWII
jgi:SNF2 family DNA or RNA helicase